MFMEGDHPGSHASAPRSSQAIAWDEPPAAKQLKGKTIEDFWLWYWASLGYEEDWVLEFRDNLVLSFEDVSSVDA